MLLDLLAAAIGIAFFVAMFLVVDLLNRA